MPSGRPSGGAKALPEPDPLIGALVSQGVRARRFLGLLDGVSLQLAFDDTVFSVAAATEFCEDALARYLR